MRRVNKLIISGLTTMGLYFLSASGIYASLENRLGFDAAVSEKDLRETYLPAFEKCVKAGSCTGACRGSACRAY